MASAFELWLTPTITLSLVLESESDVPSLSRFVSQWLLYFRPALLRQALAYELQQRPDLDVVSAGTLRIVDYAYWRATHRAPEVSRSSPLVQGSVLGQTGPPDCGREGERLFNSLPKLCGQVYRHSRGLDLTTDLRRPTFHCTPLVWTLTEARAIPAHPLRLLGLRYRFTRGRRSTLGGPFALSCCCPQSPGRLIQLETLRSFLLQEHDLLSTALDRVLGTYAIAEAAQAAADEPFPEDGSRDEQLRTLWRTLKPDTELPAITGKHWQEVRSKERSRIARAC